MAAPLVAPLAAVNAIQISEDNSIHGNLSEFFSNGNRDLFLSADIGQEFMRLGYINQLNSVAEVKNNSLIVNFLTAKCGLQYSDQWELSFYGKAHQVSDKDIFYLCRGVNCDKYVQARKPHMPANELKQFKKVCNKMQTDYKARIMRLIEGFPLIDAVDPAVPPVVMRKRRAAAPAVDFEAIAPAVAVAVEPAPARFMNEEIGENEFINAEDDNSSESNDSNSNYEDADNDGFTPSFKKELLHYFPNIYDTGVYLKFQNDSLNTLLSSSEEQSARYFNDFIKLTGL